MNMKSSCLVMVLSLLFVQCGTEQGSWEKAKSTHTSSAYEDFLKKYPESVYSDSAQMNLERLLFSEAQSLDSLSLLKTFVETYPQSQFADSARFLVEKIYFEQARSVNTKDAYRTFLNTYPESVFAKEAKHRINDFWTIKELSYSIITEISGSSAPHTKLLKKAETGCIVEIRGLYVVPVSKNATVKIGEIRLSGTSFDKDKEMSWEMSPIGQGYRGDKAYSYHFLDHIVSGAVRITSLSGEGFRLSKKFAEDPGTMEIIGKQLWLCLAFAVPQMPKSPFTLKFVNNTVIIE